MEPGRVFRHNNGLVCRKVGDELVIVPLRNNVADMNCVYTLNEVAAFIWENLDGVKTAGDIINDVMRVYNIDEITATNDVIEILTKMDGKVIS